ncbi:HD domain-containing protein [Geothermobacter ehrlichii]|uniref:HD domain-containing protein n=1 Tax=Geothermobacter ehrlichii TaxID=213224 RepID=A0A5D3WI18_9BACT|nr:HD domain-containing protein [Geothermobacter ehrlichii]TYO96728.1 HD domain-containing protein [Geothermobacter ehrlichii]
MPSDLITSVGIGCCLGLIGYAAWQFRPAPKGKNKERRLLADIARLWTGKGEVVDFREIAQIWRTTPEAARKQQEKAPNYTRKEIRDFHARWCNTATVRGEKKLVIEKILSILDQKGDCPSVVHRNPNEAEKKYDRDVFALLSRVPLWQHSLDVATRLAEGMKQAVMIPDALIAGLGHDLGKLPSYQYALYRTGDHPVLSLIALHRVPGFESMSNADDIAQAIRQHHLVAPDNPLGAALKQADQKTRLDEISRLSPAGRDIRLKPDDEQEVPPDTIQESEGEEPSTSTTDKETRLETGAESAPDMAADEEGEKTDPEDSGGQQEELSEASTNKGFPDNLDLEAVLSGLKKRINRIEKGRWSVVSIPEGLVLCQPDALWKEIRRVGKRTPELLLGDADEETKRKILAAVVERMSSELKAIETSIVAEGYYTSQCLVVMGSGKAFRSLLIPFRAEAFGVLPSHLEALKSPLLRQMVRKVKLPNQTGENE